ncbi:MULTISPECIES: phosphopantetheine-binding protein [Pseudomonas]|uniref:phosphopantetheine-binding protein n=1 Tax=Pseudomonas TaxID=286 RepID=UPI000F56BFCA|nr:MULTISPECIES: phosphopantetheine-binding protein [Pseudomonas]MDQ0980377.1 acyl carrier protein [Pseudomonas synxantha]
MNEIDPVFSMLRALLAYHFRLAQEKITSKTLIIEQLMADSLDLIDIGLQLNEVFNIDLNVSLVATSHSVEDMYLHVRTALALNENT